MEKLSSTEKRSKKKANVLLAEAYKSLGQCDYLRAHVASRFCLKHAKKSVEAHIAFAVAAARIGQDEIAFQAMQFVHKQTGFRSKSSAWGAAWAYVLLNETARGEALLDQLLAKDSGNKTLLCLLAIARSRRGKISSAISAARQACTPSAPTLTHATLLIRLLLDAGLQREAAARLSPLQNFAADDPELQTQMLRLKLLTRSFEAANGWAEIILKKDSSPPRLIRVGNYYEQAREFVRARELFEQALAAGHYPEALVALARIDREQQDKSQARRRLLTALNLKAEVPKDAVGPLPLFFEIVAQLGALQELARCSAWNAVLPTTGRSHPALANTVFLVYAPDEESARQQASVVLTAMDSTVDTSNLIWKKAAADEQPVRPVYPGIQRAVKKG